jgi:spore germination protein
MERKIDYIKERFKNTFDIKYREVDTALGPCTLAFIDDLCSISFISEYIITPLIKKDYRCTEVKDIVEHVLNIGLVNYAKDLEDTITHILSGDIVLVFRDYEEIVFCEVKGFVRRGIAVPVTESVLKGPREGFTELLVDNVSLIRRKIKNAALKFEPIFVGDNSNTLVCISYLDGIAPKSLVDYVKETISKLEIKFILDTNYLEDELRGDKKSTFDTVGYTEKPDEIASKVLEGRVAVLVDGTPFVITVPFFFLENFQAPDDYYINKYFANFTRILRWFAFFVATFLPGIYVALLTYHFGLIPSMFIFRLAVSRAGVPLPTIIEILVMMLAFQCIKEAGLRLPQPIGGAMSIVAALILGDAVVGAGIASRITIIIVAVSTLSYFLIPKLYGALSIWSIIITIFSSLFGLAGFYISSFILLIRLSELNSAGYSYLFPIASTEIYKFRDVLFRGQLKNISKSVVGRGGDNR